MTTLLQDHMSVDSPTYNLRVASTVQDMRRSLGVTVADLARASGIPGPRIAAIERGDGTTRSERYDIAVAFGWLANNRIAKGRRQLRRRTTT